MKNLKPNEVPFCINGINSNNVVLLVSGSSELAETISKRAKVVCLIETDMNEYNRHIGNRTSHDVDAVFDDGNTIDKTAANLTLKYGKFDVILIGAGTPKISEIVGLSLKSDGVVFVEGKQNADPDLLIDGTTGNIIRYTVNDHSKERAKALKATEKKLKAATAPAKKTQKPIQVIGKAANTILHPSKKVIGKPAVKNKFKSGTPIVANPKVIGKPAVKGKGK